MLWYGIVGGFNVQLNTLYVISGMVFPANHWTGTNKKLCYYPGHTPFRDGLSPAGWDML